MKGLERLGDISEVGRIGTRMVAVTDPVTGEVHTVKAKVYRRLTCDEEAEEAQAGSVAGGLVVGD